MAPDLRLGASFSACPRSGAATREVSGNAASTSTPSLHTGFANWPEYEAGLRRRGDVTIWLSEDAIKNWRAPSSGKPGGQRVYANIAIETALTIRMVFHLAAPSD